MLRQIKKESQHNRNDIKSLTFSTNVHNNLTIMYDRYILCCTIKKANQDLEMKGRFVQKITKIIMQCDKITKHKLLILEILCFYSLCIETFHSYNNKNGVFPPFEFTSPFYVMAAPNNCPSVQQDFVTQSDYNSKTRNSNIY